MQLFDFFVMIGINSHLLTPQASIMYASDL